MLLLVYTPLCLLFKNHMQQTFTRLGLILLMEIWNSDLMRLHHGNWYPGGIQFWPISCWIFLGNLKIYLHFLAIVNIEMAQVSEILPLGRQGPVYQYHCCWWLGDTKRQAISHDIDLVIAEYSSYSTRRVNSSPPSAAYQWTGSSLVQVMAFPLFGTKPLLEPMLPYC